MWMVEDAMEGQLNAGKSRQGDARELYRLELNGREVFKLQRLLRRVATNNDNYFQVEEAVELGRALRREVAKNHHRGLPPGGTGGE